MSSPGYYDAILPLKGQCYCGAVAYEIKAPPMFVNCCHCRNCQQLSGSAFAINVMIQAQHVAVTSNTQPSLKVSPPSSSASDYTAATAKNEPASTSASDADAAARAAYCPHCSTMLWATLGRAGSEEIFVRAGTLERNELVVPSAHFFTRSKHPWVSIPDGVPAYDTFPPTNEAK